MSSRDARLARCLGGRFARGRAGAILAVVIAADGQAADPGREEWKRVVLGLSGIEVIRWASGGRSVVSRLERGLGSAAVKGAGRVRARSGAKMSV